MYTINVKYKDGDSYKSYKTEKTLDSGWELEVAKENLKRIKEHYTAYSKRNNYVSIGKSENDLLKELKAQRWYSTGEKYSTWEYNINLLENDGSSKTYYISWTGYFTRLISASIVCKEDDDMSFEW